MNLEFRLGSRAAGQEYVADPVFLVDLSLLMSTCDSTWEGVCVCCVNTFMCVSEKEGEEQGHGILGAGGGQA